MLDEKVIDGRIKELQKEAQSNDVLIGKYKQEIQKLTVSIIGAQRTIVELTKLKTPVKKETKEINKKE